ncbi:alpha-tectorin [Scleropages formosus]|uniref:alpha-tectorin n=1 Tax=Scleropages formosus TaxID=113540 RepID=UPI0010FAAEED|nr:alpha-tectorin-like [Scleropages formosus]
MTTSTPQTSTTPTITPTTTTTPQTFTTPTTTPMTTTAPQTSSTSTTTPETTTEPETTTTYTTTPETTTEPETTTTPEPETTTTPITTVETSSEYPTTTTRAVNWGAFYPFGVGNGDAVIPRTDDGSSSVIPLQQTFVFFGTAYHQIYVNNNGDLTFDSAWYSYIPYHFPAFGSKDIIAPFWTDLDTRGHGVVSYRQVTSGSVLQQATNDINQYFPQLSFTATWVFIATWDRVAYFPVTNTETSFQAVLISDGYRSFVLFNYGAIAPRSPVQAGYDTINSIHYFSIPTSYDSTNLAFSSNINVQGRWAFRTDGDARNCQYNGATFQVGYSFWSDRTCQEKCTCTRSGLQCQYNPCTFSQACRPDTFRYSCQPVQRRTCTIAGDPHYYTFDGQVFHFQGTCTYVLSQACNTTLPYYRVEGKNENRGSTQVAWTRMVRVIVYDEEIEMVKGYQAHALVNGTFVAAPFSLRNGSIQVYQSGFSLAISTDFGLLVTYDAYHYVTVNVPYDYYNSTCGLCGVFNLNPGDDFLSSSGQIMSSDLEFANSWQVSTDPDPQCQRAPCVGLGCSDCSSDQRTLFHSAGQCGILQDPNGPFAPCQQQLPPQNYADSCVLDLCVGGGYQPILCQALSAYSTQCQQLGIQPGPWRRQGFCEISCPANSHFESNGTGCPASCSNPTSPSNCVIPPRESCVCNQGYVLSAGTCVPLGQCGCTFEGRYYSSGDTVLLDENCGRQCSCNLGTMTCTAHSCGPMETCGVQDGVRGCQPLSYSTCWVEGHQFYRTFDGPSFQYPGACGLVISKVMEWSQQQQFRITTQMVPSGPQGTDFTRILNFEANNISVSIEIGPISLVKVNGEAASLPFSTQPGRISVYHSSVTSIRLKTDFGVALQVDWPYLIRITVPSSYNGTLGGLCGNFNGNPADEFQTPNGTLATSAQAFGDSWRNGSLSNLCTETFHDTVQRGNDTSQYQNSCSIMSLSGGPFDQCRLVENPTQRIADCVEVLSLTNGDHSVLCEALRNYALLCQQNGITVGDWRNYINCEPSCPSNSHYEICGTSCPAMCPSLSFPFLCSQPCQEGCQCNDGYLLSDSLCVRTTNCGCHYGGHYYQGGQSFWDGNECSSFCTCDGTTGTVRCTPSSCSYLESCRIVDGEYGCHPLPEGVCLASGDPHYSTFDGHRFDFQGTCHYILASLCNLTDDIEAFEVAARNQPVSGRPVSFTAEVFINVYGHQVDISSGYGRQGEIISGQHSAVQVDGVTRNLPLSLNNSQLVIYQNGFQTFVEADFGLTVHYDGWSTVSISLPSRYRGRTCGICGNFNGNGGDDFVTRSGELVASASDFSSSWRVPGNYTCDDGCGDSCSACPDQTVAQSMCEVLHSIDGPMAFCHDHVDPEPYYTNCVFDVCLSGNRHDIRCQAIQTYVSACQAASARVNPWREQTQCLIECPANSHYEVCGTDCNSTCASSLNSTCEQTCREGCFCDEGYFRSGANCVPAEHCGCQFDGFYFTAGDKFWTSGCSEHCECTESGQLRCSPAHCSATEECGIRQGRLGCFDRLSTCTVTGDPHYFTFDGAIVHFQGTCSYEVARTCGNETSDDLTFRVVASNQHRGNTRVAFVSSVDVWLRQGGQETHIFMGQSRNVKVDGTQVPLPSNIMSMVEILKDGNFVVLNVSSDLTIHFDGRSTLFIRLGESYRNSVCGMCGNFNGDPTDDKALPNGAVVLTDDEFGAGWKSDTSTPGCGASDVTGGGNNCTMMQDYSELCGIITLSSGPFSNCHLHIDPTPYFTSCVLDLCLYSSANHMLCSAVAAYEAVCSAVGFQIPEWRSHVHCPLTDPCDELECADNEWCGERNGVYGCLCSGEQNNTDAEYFDSEEICNGSSATISLSRCQLFQSGFPSNSLHLNDRSCTGTVRDGRLEFHFDNDDHICGTTLTSNGTHFIYQNTIHGETYPQGAIIRREKILSVPFNCAYLLSQSLSMSNTIRPLESILRKKLPTGVGHYQMRMIPYLDAQFQQPFTGSEMEMALNRQVYVAVEVEGVDGRQISTVIDSCWATPINDPLSSVRWDLIVQECPNPADGTVQILQNGISTSSRFSFKMFTFTSNSTTVFLHCQIHLCVLSGNNCSTSCYPGNQQRVRRSVKFQDTSSMSIGPFVLQQTQTDTQVLERISVAGAPASVSSLLPLILSVVAAVVLH